MITLDKGCAYEENYRCSIEERCSTAREGWRLRPPLGRRPSARRVLLSWLCCRSSFWLQLLAAFRCGICAAPCCPWLLATSPVTAAHAAHLQVTFACNHSLLLLLLPATGCCSYLPIWSKISMGGFRMLSVSSVPHGLFLLLIIYKQPLAAQDVPFLQLRWLALSGTVGGVARLVLAA